MMAWIGDLIGQVIAEKRRPCGARELQGLVLIDEIDLHLHPTWQRRCIPILKKIFPNVQFVVTTHSPLVLTGFEQHEIVRLRLEDGLVVQQQLEFETAALNATQLMTTFFDVPFASRPAIEQAQRRYVELRAQSSLAHGQRLELEELEVRLRPYVQLRDPQPAPTSIADVSARIDALEADG